MRRPARVEKRVAVNTPLSPSARAELTSTLAMPAILYEDGLLLAVSKPAGLVTHPAYKHPDGTLSDIVFARQAARGEDRPWLLHRLDRETSGVVLFAKTPLARRALVRQFERRTVRKLYLAITHGAPDNPEGEIDAPLLRDPSDRRRVVVDPHGQSAQTRFRVLARAGDHALIAAEPLTGRTHQIRAHLAYVGAPIAGDATYQSQPNVAEDACARTLLHAFRLDARYPGGGDAWSVVAPVPDDFRHAAAHVGLGAALERQVLVLQEDSCSSPHSIR